MMTVKSFLAGALGTSALLISSSATYKWIIVPEREREVEQYEKKVTERLVCVRAGDDSGGFFEAERRGGRDTIYAKDRNGMDFLILSSNSDDWYCGHSLKDQLAAAKPLGFTPSPIDR